MTTFQLSQVASFYRKSALCELVKFQHSIDLNPAADPMLVEAFDQMMVREFGEMAEQFNAKDFFGGYQ